MTAKQVGNYLLIITLQEDNMNKRTLALAAVATLGLSTAAFAQNPAASTPTASTQGTPSARAIAGARCSQNAGEPSGRREESRGRTSPHPASRGFACAAWRQEGHRQTYARQENGNDKSLLVISRTWVARWPRSERGHLCVNAGYPCKCN